VVVVGAGPAGAAAATFLSRAGARVTLLERARFPRDKVCGDGCSPRTMRVLEALGAERLPAMQAQPMRAFYARSPGGWTLDAELPQELFGGRGCVVPRQVLDEHLVRIATAAGAELREGVHVESVEVASDGARVRFRDGATLDADVVLGCDGSPSVVRRSLGAPDFAPGRSAYAVRAYYEGASLSRPEAFGLFWERELLPGYAWIFPLPDGRANVGVGMRADLLPRLPFKLPELLERFCRSPFGRQELGSARPLSKARGHHLPFGERVDNIVFDRALLLGDAAGFINPLTGEGIELAMESGQFAAEAVREAADAGDFSARGLSGYLARCRARFDVPFRLNGRLMSMFERPKLVDRIVRAARRSRRVQVELAAVMLGVAQRISPRLAVAAALGL
jgi:geranylgeranyl reductase family protein